MAVKTKARKTMEEVHPSAYQVARNIEKMMIENNDSKDTIANLLGINRSTLWRRLVKSPYDFTLEELDILCEYWGIELSELTRDPSKSRPITLADIENLLEHLGLEMKPQIERGVRCG